MTLALSALRSPLIAKGWLRTSPIGKRCYCHEPAERLPPARHGRDCRLACRCGRIGTNHFHHRSEEHTSELQSLMRISYAVFCLKKKTNTYLKKYQHIQ